MTSSQLAVAEVIEPIEPSRDLAIVVRPDAPVQTNIPNVKAQVALDLVDYPLAIVEGTVVDSETTYKEAKASRAYLNSKAAAWDNQRKGFTGDLNRLLKEVKAKVDTEVIAPYKERSEILAAKIAAYEEAWKRRRYKELEEYYAEVMDFAAKNVPYGRVHEDAWLNRTPLEEARDAIFSKCEKIAKDEAEIDATLADMGAEKFVDDAKARYFETLDFGAAISRARELKKSEDDARAFREQKEAVETGQEAARQAAQPPAGAPPAADATQERLDARASLQEADRAAGREVGVHAIPQPPQTAEERPLREPVFAYRLEFECGMSVAKEFAVPFGRLVRAWDINITSSHGKGFECTGRVS